MIDKTMMGSMNKRSVNKGSTLRMPAKFSYMTEEEAEYDGNGCWAWVLTIFGGLGILGGAGCFAVHFVWDIGDRKTMVIAGSALFAVGAVCLGFCTGSTTILTCIRRLKLRWWFHSALRT